MKSKNKMICAKYIHFRDLKKSIFYASWWQKVSDYHFFGDALTLFGTSFMQNHFQVKVQAPDILLTLLSLSVLYNAFGHTYMCLPAFSIFLIWTVHTCHIHFLSWPFESCSCIVQEVKNATWTSLPFFFFFKLCKALQFFFQQFC